MIKKVSIVTYAAATGPAGELANYFADLGMCVVVIRHPLPGYFGSNDVGRTFVSEVVEVTQDGETCLARIGIFERLPVLLRLGVHFILSIIWLVRYGKRSTIVFGAGNINAVAASAVRSIGLARWAAFYAIDFAPVRFGSFFLDRMYLCVEWLAVITCDIVWNLSPAMPAARRERIRLPWIRAAPDLIVPMGTAAFRSDLQDILQIRSKKPVIAYMGVLNPNSGVDILIKSLEVIQKKIPTISCIIIGTGSKEQDLKNLSNDLLQENSYEFTGFINDHRIVEELLAKAWIGVAPYRDDPSSFTRFADPGKLKTYLSLALPIIMTNVPAISKNIEVENCGIITDATPQGFANAIISLLESADKRSEMEQNAFRLGETFVWAKIFEKAMRESEHILLISQENKARYRRT